MNKLVNLCFFGGLKNVEISMDTHDSVRQWIKVALINLALGHEY